MQRTLMDGATGGEGAKEGQVTARGRGGGGGGGEGRVH